MSTQLFIASLADLVVATGTTDSRIVKCGKTQGLTEGYDAEAYYIEAPTNTDGKTYTIQTSVDGTNFVTLTDLSANNIKVPGASTSMVYNGVITGMPFWRIHASGATSVDVAFHLWKSHRL